VAPVTVLLSVAKSKNPVVAGAAKVPIPVFRLGNFRGSCHHFEVELVVAHPAGILYPVKPVRKGDGQAAMVTRVSVHKKVPIQRSRWEGRKAEILTEN
jgi:hypothetical protein